MIGLLLAGLDRRGLVDTTDLIIVSDHGMSATSRKRVVFLDDYVDIEAAAPVDWDPLLGLWPRESDREQVFRSLSGAHPHLRVFRRHEIPPELHYSDHRRIPPIVAIADDGWAITSRARFASCRTCFTGGNHGFDNRLDSMAAFFVAAGPSFRKRVRLPELDNVHLYNLMCAVLGLEPAENDGSYDVIAPLLRRTEPGLRH